MTRPCRNRPPPPCAASPRPGPAQLTPLPLFTTNAIHSWRGRPVESRRCDGVPPPPHRQRAVQPVCRRHRRRCTWRRQRQRPGTGRRPGRSAHAQAGERKGGKSARVQDRTTFGLAPRPSYVLPVRTAVGAVSTEGSRRGGPASVGVASAGAAAVGGVGRAPLRKGRGGTSPPRPAQCPPHCIGSVPAPLPRGRPSPPRLAARHTTPASLHSGAATQPRAPPATIRTYGWGVFHRRCPVAADSPPPAMQVARRAAHPPRASTAWRRWA